MAAMITQAQQLQAQANSAGAAERAQLLQQVQAMCASLNLLLEAHRESSQQVQGDIAALTDDVRRVRGDVSSLTKLQWFMLASIAITAVLIARK